MDVVVFLSGLGVCLSHQVDSNGNSLAHLAVKQNNLEFIVDLALRGVDPTLKNNLFQTPKIMARKLGLYTFDTS